MTGFSEITGQALARPSGPRYLVKWPARFFAADRIIRSTHIQSVFESGFSVFYSQALPIGLELDLEFVLNYAHEPYKMRVKSTVHYCLLRSNGDGAEIDLITSEIKRADEQLLNRVLLELSEAKEFNLRFD